MKDAYDIGCRLYFAYGANMSEAQLRERCNTHHVIGVARLRGHRVAFFGASKRWDGAEETVVPAPGEDVWGVIYRLNFNDAELLDSWQDVRLDGTGPYFHYPATVTDAAGAEYPIILYKRDQLDEPGMPSTEYLERILAAAKDRGLPAAYRDRLSLTPSKKASYPVPKTSRFSRSLLLDRCSGCHTE